MSAYGAIAAPSATAKLEPLLFPLKKGGCISIYPLSASEAPDEMVSYLHEVFSKELEEGRTYPQEGPLDLEGFKSYFFLTASTTVIGILHPEVLDTVPANIEQARNGRPWEEVVGGFFYIKPNYPGRASHNCNGGFVVPHAQRGRGSSHHLAEAFCTYAPQLGYRQSVFNLVFANNHSSLAVWEKHGFTRVGTIPNAGRLNTGPNGSEEYVDAHIIWRSFV